MYYIDYGNNDTFPISWIICENKKIAEDQVNLITNYISIVKGKVNNADDETYMLSASIEFVNADNKDDTTSNILWICDNCYESSNSFDTVEVMLCKILNDGKACIIKNKIKSFNVVSSIGCIFLPLFRTLKLISFLMVSNNIISGESSHFIANGMRQCVDKSSINTNICGSNYVMNNGQTIKPVCAHSNNCIILTHEQNQELCFTFRSISFHLCTPCGHLLNHKIFDMEVDFMLTDAAKRDTVNFILWDKHSDNGCVMILNINENESRTIQIHNLDNDNDISNNDIYTFNLRIMFNQELNCVCLMSSAYLTSKVVLEDRAIGYATRINVNSSSVNDNGSNRIIFEASSDNNCDLTYYVNSESCLNIALSRIVNINFDISTYFKEDILHITLNDSFNDISSLKADNTNRNWKLEEYNYLLQNWEILESRDDMRFKVNDILRDAQITIHTIIVMIQFNEEHINTGKGDARSGTLIQYELNNNTFIRVTDEIAPRMITNEQRTRLIIFV